MGIFPWLREALFGKPEPTCTWGGHAYCSSLRHPECGSGHCAEHCQLFCRDRCKKPPPKLGVVLGMRR